VNEKRKISHNTLKLLLIVSIAILAATLYSLFKEEIYTWSCHNENVESSCMVVGMINQDKGHDDTAREYFTKACEMKYQLACDRLKTLGPKK
jgi:TPR repeat protein